jgi:hypothetical protein
VTDRGGWKGAKSWGDDGGGTEMERPGNQCVRSIDPRCGCAHEKGRRVTRFIVIHRFFDCVEPLTYVVHSGGQRRDSRLISELSTSGQRPLPSVRLSNRPVLLADVIFFGLAGDCGRTTSRIKQVTWWSDAATAGTWCRRSRSRVGCPVHRSDENQ